MENNIDEKVLDEVNAEINESIDDAKNKLKEQDIEIEVNDEPITTKKEEKSTEAKKTEISDEDMSAAVQRRIKK